MHKINLSPEAFVSWETPIEMLYACHGKVKRFCHQLTLLPAYLEQNGVNQAVKSDVKQILTYFNLSAPLHHDDEEVDLFPALLAASLDVQDSIDLLASQHHELHQNWAALSAQLEALLMGERQNIDADLIEQFVAGYQKHIEIEEPLFELAKQHLSQDILAQMGQSMSARRKLN